MQIQRITASGVTDKEVERQISPWQAKM